MNDALRTVHEPARSTAVYGEYDVVVLGGGATASSVLLALAELGLERATVLVREPARAAETVDVYRTAIAVHGA